MLSNSGSRQPELAWNPSFTIVVSDGFLTVTCEDFRGRTPLPASITSADGLLIELARANPDSSKSLAALRSGLLRQGILLAARGPVGREFNPVTSKQLGVFARFGDPDELQARVNVAHVLILGCGAVGLAIAQGLAAAGVGALTLLDFDVVESGNLNRQYLYTLGDIGCSKIVAAARRLRERYSNLSLQTIDQRIARPEDLMNLYAEVGPDLSICAIDQPPGVLTWAYEASRSTGIPTLSAAIGLRYGHFGPIATVAPPLLAPHSAFQDIPTTSYSLGTTSAMVSFGGCHLALSYLSRSHDSAYWGSIHTIDFDRMTLTTNPLDEPA